jgi:basic membrane protein A and related proteins
VRRQRLGLWMMAISAGLVLSGCGRTENTGGGTVSNPANTGGGAATGKTLKVALITPGAVSDNGWNANAYDGVKAVEKELGAEVQNVEAKTDGDQDKELQAFGSKGFDIVFAHGNEFDDKCAKIESQFPKTLFVVSSGRKVGTNTTPIVLRLEDGAYLLGMLAAGMSKTGKLGMVGAMQIVAVDSSFKAFEAGAKAIKPDITIIPAVYTGSWDDVAKAKQQTSALLDQGADIIMQNVDAASAGVFQAVQERNKPDAPRYALGTNRDQNGVAPDVILASAPIQLDKAFVLIAKGVKEGTFKPNDTPFDMKNGAIGFILNPQLMDKIPADLKTKLEDAQKKITDGTLKVPIAG